MNFYPLVRLLSTEIFKTGTELGAELGISRTAVWKQIQQLEQLGIEIITKPQQGYKLAKSINLFNELLLKQLLIENKSNLDLYLFSSLGSTNVEAKNLLNSPEVKSVLVLTEMQTAGKGRRGRTWQSPFGQNLAITLGAKIDTDISKLQGLSLAIAVELKESLNKFAAIDVGFKWPNDIYVNDKKLCGILVEVAGDFSGPFSLIMGIGLNLKSSSAFNSIDQPYICLDELGIEFDKNLFAIDLAVRLEKMISKFLNKGFQAWQARWNKAHLWKDKQAEVIHSNLSKRVTLKQVNSDGALLVINSEGNEEVINSGEISLRLAE